MRSYIGIDPGVTNLGLAAIIDDADLGIATTTVTKMSFPATPGAATHVVSDFLRCRELEKQLNSWLDEKLVPKFTRPVRVEGHRRFLGGPVVTVEGPAFARGGSKTVQVGFLHMGIYTAISKLRSLSLVVCPPMVLKKWVTGKGNAKKEAVMEGIIRKWFRNDIPDFGSQDLYEAYALAMVGEAVVNGTAPKWMLDKVRIYTVSRGTFEDVT